MNDCVEITRTTVTESKTSEIRGGETTVTEVSESKPADSNPRPWLEEQMAASMGEASRQLGDEVFENDRELSKFAVFLNAGGVGVVAAMKVFHIWPSILFAFGLIASFSLCLANVKRIRHANRSYGDRLTSYQKGEIGIVAACMDPESKQQDWPKAFTNWMHWSLGISLLLFFIGAVWTLYILYIEK